MKRTGGLSKPRRPPLAAGPLKLSPTSSVYRTVDASHTGTRVLQNKKGA